MQCKGLASKAHLQERLLQVLFNQVTALLSVEGLPGAGEQVVDEVAHVRDSYATIFVGVGVVEIDL